MLLAIFAAVAARADPPTDQEGFTRYALSVFQRQVASHHFTYVGPLELTVSTGGPTESQHLYLDRIYQYTLHNPEQADVALASYASRVSATLEEMAHPPAKSDLTLAVRTAKTVNAGLKALGAGSVVAAYPQALTDSLFYLPVFNTKTAFKWLNGTDLKRLGLAENEALKLARANLRAALRPIAEVTTVPEPGQDALGSIYNDLAPSRLLFPEDWAPVAKRFGGKLVVMVPSSDLILFCNGSSRQAVDALRTYGANLADHSQAPVSKAVLVWTGTGWHELE